jgi:hypothetical protein
MDSSLSDKVRATAKTKYIQPAKQAGKREVSIAVRDLLKDDLDKAGFPGNRVPSVCSAIRTRGFLRENGLEIISIDGPASKTSPTVVFHYRIKDENPGGGGGASSPPAVPSSEELPRERAKRLVAELRGLLKIDLAEHGGVEGFMRWVRGHDEEGR